MANQTSSSPVTATAKALIFKRSHGKSLQISLPPGSSAKGTEAAIDVGFALDAAITNFMRTHQVNVPTLTTAFASGYGGPPLFSALAPDVHPSLAATIMAAALSKKATSARIDLGQTISEISQTYKLSPEQVEQLLTAANTLTNRIHERSFARLVTSIMTDQSNGRTGAALIGAYANTPSLSWDTLKGCYAVLSRMYGDLAARVDLEIIINHFDQLYGDPEYRRLYDICVGARTLPISMTAMSLYSLWDMHRTTADAAGSGGYQSSGATSRPIKKGKKKGAPASGSDVATDNTDDILPVIRPISANSDSFDPGLRDLFDIPRQMKEGQEPGHQYRYWRVSNPFAGRVDLPTIMKGVLKYDQSVFGLPTFELDLLSAIEVTAYKGSSIGLPAFSAETSDIWQDPGIQALLGYSALELVTTDYGDSLSNTMLGHLRDYRLNDNNMHLVPKIQAHIATLIAIFKAFTGLRNTFADTIEKAESFSFRVAESTKISIQHLDTRLMHMGSFIRYRSFYQAVLDNLASAPLIEGSPSSLYHLSRVVMVPKHFSLADANFSSTVILHPQIFRAGNLISFRRPFVEFDGSRALFLSSGVGEGSTWQSQNVRSAYSRISAISERHTVVHGFTEEVQDDGFGISGLIRYMPLEVSEFFSKVGRAAAVRFPDQRLPVELIISELNLRSIKGFVTSNGVPSLEHAMLGLAQPDTGMATVEVSNVTEVIQKRFVTSYTPGLVKLMDDSETSVFGLSSVGSYLDLGSQSFIFLFDAVNQVFFEDANSMREGASLICPVLVSHESDQYAGMSIIGLMSSESPTVPSGAEFELRNAFRLESAPSAPIPFGATRNAAPVPLPVNDFKGAGSDPFSSTTPKPATADPDPTVSGRNGTDPEDSEKDDK